MQTEGPNKEGVGRYGQESLLAPAKYWQVSPSRSVEQEFDGQPEVLNDGSILVSSSPAMLAIRQQIEKIAEYDIPVACRSGCASVDPHSVSGTGTTAR
jgi:hypothetical protein